MAPDILAFSDAIGFTLSSNMQTGSLLRILAASKPGGKFLELGTGTGHSAAWIQEGMDMDSTLMTIDTNPDYVAIARHYLGDDPRILFIVNDAGIFLKAIQDQRGTFDLIFADTIPGKFTYLNETLELLKVGGLYVVDSMLPQANWPVNHAPRVAELIATLEERSDLRLSKLHWSTGVIIAAKVKRD
jgi:predicted O-methyltransferase YrrM